MCGKIDASEISPPAGRRRFVINLLIIAFILWQIALPASYYLGFHGDIYDERFRWRMFSSKSVQPCNVDVKEHLAGPDGNSLVRKLDLEKAVDRIWLSLLNHNVAEVSEKLLRQRCSSHPWMKKAVYERNCRSASGDFLDSDRLVLECGTGEFSVTRGQN